MYLKQITKNNITRLYFYESIYEPGPQNNGKGKTKHKLMKCLGNLEDLRKDYEDPVKYFTDLAKKETASRKAEKNVQVPIDMTSELQIGEDNLKNVGYTVLKMLYKDLELDKFWKSKLQGKQIKYDLELIFRLLVISRILFPASKKETFENRHRYFEEFDGFSLDDIYHALDIIDENQIEMQKWIYSHSLSILKRDMSVTYFDCTNYYFDIGRSDLDNFDEDGNPIDGHGNPAEIKYRKRGPEKNHRPDPIVEMGLLMDRNGIPIAYDLFPGNESEKLHMLPIVDRVKSDFSCSRTIIVADRGLNTSDNIYYLNGCNRSDNNQRDGYVYGQSVRGATNEFKKWVLSNGYKVDTVVDEAGEKVIFRHKSRVYPKELNVNVTGVNGRQKKVKVKADQKQMVYYSEKYAEKQRQDRLIMVERARDLIRHPKKYDRITCAGSASYILNLAFDKETGEVVENKALILDTAKIEEESKYDGYYSIVTSELDMSDSRMHEVYRGLAKIEETFKISKTDFEARPIFLTTNEHIDAHFATCFTALVIIRLLENKLEGKFSVGQILKSLRSYNCVKIDTNTFQFCYFDNILAECEKVFGIRLRNKYARRLQIRRMLKY